MNLLSSLVAKRLTQRWPGCLRLAVAITVCACISACGPGTGGTGVGPISGTYISLNAGATAPTVPGTAYVLMLDPTRIRLTGACLAFQFEGPWVQANGEIRVTGTYRQAAPAGDLALAPPQAGTLLVRVESSGLTVSLQDARGTVIVSFATAAAVADGVAVAPLPSCKSLPAGSTP